MDTKDKELIVGLLYEYLGWKFKKNFQINYENENKNHSKVDLYAEITDEKKVFVEIERKQKHSCTNILKVGPYIDKNQKYSVFFIHVFFHDSTAPSNRKYLSKWIGKRFEKMYKNRFCYFILYIDADEKPTNIQELAKSLNKFISPHSHK